MSRHIPHLRVPFSIGRDGTARTVDQDTPEEVAQCVRVLVGTRPGDRQAVPAYGVDDLTFSDARTATDEAWLAEAAREWEPRATVEMVRSAVAQSGRVDVSYEVRA